MRLSSTSMARVAARRPWFTISMWAVALVAAGAGIALLMSGALTAQYSFLNDPDSQHGRDLLAQKMNQPIKANEVIVVRSQTAHASDPAFKAFVLDLQRRVAGLGSSVVDSTASYAAGGDRTLVSQDGRTAIIPLTMAGDLTTAEDNIDKVHQIVHAADGKGGFDALITGTASIQNDFSQTANKDLQRGESIGLHHRARDPADRLRRPRGRHAAHLPQPHRDHAGDRADRAVRAHASTSRCSPST